MLVMTLHNWCSANGENAVVPTVKPLKALSKSFGALQLFENQLRVRRNQTDLAYHMSTVIKVGIILIQIIAMTLQSSISLEIIYVDKSEVLQMFLLLSC